MADFQTSVNIYPAIGVPGAFASINPVVSTALGKIAGTDLTIGGFCWGDTSNVGQVKNTGTGKPLGFVARDVIYPINTLVSFPDDDETGNASNIVPKGYNVNVMVEGDFYVLAPATVTVGQKVFANTTDGTIKVGDAGSTVSGAVETDWAFMQAGDEGDIVVISNYGATPAVSTTAAAQTMSVVTDVTGENDEVTVTKNTVKVING